MTDTLLRDRAMRLQTRVAELSRLRGVANQALRFHTRADELERPTQEIEVWVHVLDVFRQHGVPVSLDASVATAIRQMSARLATDFAANPETILEADPVLRRNFWSPLGNLPNLLRAAIQTAWVAYVDSAVPSRHEELLDVLIALPSFREQVSKIRSLYRTVDDLKTGFTPSADIAATLEQPRRLAADITHAVAQLEGPGVPAEALAFVKAASAHPGATMEQFTETVQQWLSEHNLLNAVRLRLGGL